MPEKKTKNSWSPWSPAGGWKGRRTMEEKICGRWQCQCLLVHMRNSRHATGIIHVTTWQRFRHFRFLSYLPKTLDRSPRLLSVQMNQTPACMRVPASIRVPASVRSFTVTRFLFLFLSQMADLIV